MPNDNTSIEPDEDPNEEVVTPETINIDTGVVAAGFKVDNDVMMGIDFNTSRDTVNSILNSVNANLTVTSYLDRNGNPASGNIGTGDTLLISNGKDVKAYKVIIYGDNNGDGKVSVLDLLRCQKYLLGNNNITGNDIKATDTNGDGTVNVVDLLRIQKQILGENAITQKR